MEKKYLHNIGFQVSNTWILLKLSLNKRLISFQGQPNNRGFNESISPLVEDCGLHIKILSSIGLHDASCEISTNYICKLSNLNR